MVQGEFFENVLNFLDFHMKRYINGLKYIVVSPSVFEDFYIYVSILLQEISCPPPQYHMRYVLANYPSPVKGFVYPAQGHDLLVWLALPHR